MALNPNTFTDLYNKGLLDYVPYELMGTTPIAPMTGMINPYNTDYLKGISSSNLSQITQDNFCHQHSNQNNQGQLHAGDNFSKTMPTTGFNNIQADLNGGGISQIGSVGTSNSGMLGGTNGTALFNNPDSGINGMGFGQLGDNVASGVGKVKQAISSTPNFVKGIISGALIIGTVAMCIKKGKAPKGVKK